MPDITRPLPLPRWCWRLLFWLLVLAVSGLMLVPQPPSALDTGWDKLNHVLAFAAPSFTGMASLARPTRQRTLALWTALLAWGAALEWLQGWVPPRSADPMDWLADAAGVVLGAALFSVLARSLSSRPQ